MVRACAAREKASCNTQASLVASLTQFITHSMTSAHPLSTRLTHLRIIRRGRAHLTESGSGRPLFPSVDACASSIDGWRSQARHSSVISRWPRQCNVRTRPAGGGSPRILARKETLGYRQHGTPAALPLTSRHRCVHFARSTANETRFGRRPPCLGLVRTKSIFVGRSS